MANEAAHPSRYPKHDDPLKGQVFGGECNRTACDNHGAVYWNVETFGFYCPTDARAINYDPKSPPLCIKVEAKPALSEMEPMRRARYLAPIQ